MRVDLPLGEIESEELLKCGSRFSVGRGNRLSLDFRESIPLLYMTHYLGDWMLGGSVVTFKDRESFLRKTAEEVEGYVDILSFCAGIAVRDQ